jgi:hypothetical protein
MIACLLPIPGAIVLVAKIGIVDVLFNVSTCYPEHGETTYGAGSGSSHHRGCKQYDIGSDGSKFHLCGQ